MSSVAYLLKHECASRRALITHTQTSTDILFCDKTRVPMFYFLIIIFWMSVLTLIQRDLKLFFNA